MDIVSGGNVETFVGPLSGGRAVAAILNRTPKDELVIVELDEVFEREVKGKVRVNSAWGEKGGWVDKDKKEDENKYNDEEQGQQQYLCNVPAHGAALLVFEPQEKEDK